jgi:hypothetical protein
MFLTRLLPLLFAAVLGLGGCGSTENDSRDADAGNGDGSSGSAGNSSGGSDSTGGRGGAPASGGSSGNTTGGSGGSIGGTGGAGGIGGSAGTGGASGGGGSSNDAGAICPDHAPRLPQYPFTPEPCSFEEVRAQLSCEYETPLPASPSVVCQTTFACRCLSDHMGGADCYWNAEESICPDAGM